MALTTQARSRLSATFGTAPRRVSPGVWQTRTGRMLGPASSAYWEHQFRAGRFDATGHRVTPSVVNQVNNRDVLAHQPKTAAVKPGRPGGGDFSGSRPEIQTAHKQAAAWAKEISKTQLSPEDAAGLKQAGFDLGPFGRDLSAIINGAPRAAWTTGKAIGNLPFELVANGVRGKQTAPSIVTDVFEPLGKAYNQKYVEPTRHGDFGQLWKNIKETPISSLLDASLLASGGTTGAIRAARFAGAEGGLSARVAASRVQPPRILPTGETSVEIPQSQNELAAIIQRKILDPLSVKMNTTRQTQLGADRIPTVPAAFTSDVRAAKQQFRDMTQQMRRVRSLHAQEMRDVKGIPKKARARAWYEFQLPEGVGTVQVAQNLREHAHTTMEEGTASARLAATENLRPPVRNTEAERVEARSLLEKAAKAEASGKHFYDPKAKDAARTLMNTRKQIFVDAGKLDPEEAAQVEGSMARELGVEPSGSEVYMHHGVKKQRRGLGGFGGPRTVEGAPKPPPGIGTKREMLAYRSGRVLTDPREVVRAFDQAQAYHFNNMVREYVGKVGPKLADGETPHPGWYIINKEGQRVPRRFKDATPESIAHAEGISIDKALERDIKDYVDNYIAKAGSKEADAMVANARKQGVELRQVSPEVVHRLINPRNTAGSQSTAGYVGSAVSDIVRASLIYANPGYVPANLIGNFGFLATSQGPKAPVNMARAGAALLARGMRGNLSHEERLRLRDLLRGEVGMGPTVAVLSGGKGVVQQGIAHLARAEGLVADDWLRLADWIGQARKQGIKTPQQQLEFLTNAAKGDEDAISLANRVKARMEEAMVSFDRAGPRERDIASKWLFVWPWIRGASRYPFTTARDMPIRAALGARASENAANDPSMDAPPHPSWLDIFKVGPGKFVAPRAASTVSTPLEMVQQITDALRGKNNRGLLDAANPLVRFGADVGTGKNRYGQEKGAWGVFKEEGSQLSPAYTTGKELVNPSASPKVFGPQSRADVLKRRFGRGLIPFSIDERAAYKQARKTMKPAERWKNDTAWLERDYEKVLPHNPALKERLDAAIGWQHFRASERLKFYAKHQHDPDQPIDPKNPTALDKLEADLHILRDLGRISQQKADTIYAAAVHAYADPLRRSHVSRDIAYLGVHYFYADAFSKADHAIKKAGSDPPRRLSLP